MPVRLVDMVGQAGMCTALCKGIPFGVFTDVQSSEKNTFLQTLDNSCSWIEKTDFASPLHVDELVGISRTHTENGAPAQTCPWKAAREAVSGADVFVGDYNHLFDEGVRTSSLKAMDLSLEDIIVVVDEAHNLPDHIRMTLEKRLTQTMIRNTQIELEEYAGVLAQAMKAPGGEPCPCPMTSPRGPSTFLSRQGLGLLLCLTVYDARLVTMPRNAKSGLKIF